MSNRSQYERYIASDKWRKRRDAYFAKHSRVCRVCWGEDDIQLHHKTYVRMGSERDADLVPLCQVHHSMVHDHHRMIGGSLFEATDLAIKLLTAKRARSDTRKSVEFVPRNLRGATVGEDGRLMSSTNWRDEVRNGLPVRRTP